MSDLRALRAFVPAHDFAGSLAFYEAVGFAAEQWSDGLACLRQADFSFVLQAFAADGFAENFMMQMVVSDLDAWWAKLLGADVVARFGVRTPAPPELQPWGIITAYLWDPAGVLWHVTGSAAARPS